MGRSGLAALMLAATLVAGAGPAFAQAAPPLPTMPRPPSFSDPVAGTEAKGKKATRKANRGAAPQASGAGAGSATSFERPNRFVPAEFDGERRLGGGGGRMQPMMSGSGQPGMGMKF